jgi:hypothetical protein
VSGEPSIAPEKHPSRANSRYAADTWPGKFTSGSLPGGWPLEIGVDGHGMLRRLQGLNRCGPKKPPDEF